MPSNIAAEVESLKSAVAKYFPIYEVRASYDSLTVYISPDKKSLNKNFDSLRKELFSQRYVPILKYSGGEYTISIIRKPALKRRSVWVNYVFLGITLITTTLSGALYWADYSGSGVWTSFDSLLWGMVFFAIPIMAILGTHELSHYLMSKRHGVESSLPFFIPAPPLIGTFGAFISMRDPMPNRRALVQIGIAGPIGGLLVTIPVAILGLILTASGPAHSGAVGEGGALAVTLQPLYQLFLMIVPLPDNVALHPLAFAAWVGFLVTAINLLPAGQLDGGHVARGLLGEKAKYLSFASMGMLLVLGLFFYDSWIIFALLILILGLRHPAPLDDVSKLDVKSQVLGAIGLAILLITFVPTPLSVITPDHSFDMSTSGVNEKSVLAGENVTFEILFTNTGNTDINILMNVENITSGWNAILYLNGSSGAGATNSLSFSLPYASTRSVILSVNASDVIGESSTILVKAATSDQSRFERSTSFTITVE